MIFKKLLGKHTLQPVTMNFLYLKIGNGLQPRVASHLRISEASAKRCIWKKREKDPIIVFKLNKQKLSGMDIFDVIFLPDIKSNCFFDSCGNFLNGKT